VIDKTLFKTQKFLTYDIVKTSSQIGNLGIYRVSNIKDLPANNPIQLRNEIRDIVWEKADVYRLRNSVKFSDLDIVEICCRIPIDTTKKAINGKYKMTRNFLAKFTVGLQLSLEEANNLFRLEGGKLNLTNAFDYIVYHALRDHDDIHSFIQEVYDLLNIHLDRDSKFKG